MGVYAYGNYHEKKRNYGFWEKENTEKYKEYRRKWEENPKKSIVENAPINLDIETSAVCNLMCPMCVATVERLKGDKAAFKGGVMSMELYKRIIDEAAEIGVCAVKLNWRGEPLMNPNIIQMVKYAKEKGILDVLMNTNAVFLNREMAYGLIEAGIDQVIFSVDSVEKETYESIRIGAKFDEVIENIKEFCRINEENGHKVRTRVQRVLLEETAGEQKKYEDFFADYIDVIAYDECLPFGTDPYEELVKRGEEFPKFKCPQPWQRLTLDWQGESYICCQGMNYPIGSICEQTIQEIWLGEEKAKVCKLHTEGRWYEHELCKRCHLPYLNCKK